MQAQFTQFKTLVTARIPNVYEETDSVFRGVPYAIVSVQDDRQDVYRSSGIVIEEVTCVADVIYPLRDEAETPMRQMSDTLLSDLAKFKVSNMFIRLDSVSVSPYTGNSSKTGFTITCPISLVRFPY